MEFNEFRKKVKEALPDFLTDDLKNAEIKDTAVNKLQGESYSGISVTPEGSRVGISINLEDAFLDYQTGSQFTAVMNRLADTLVVHIFILRQFMYFFIIKQQICGEKICFILCLRCHIVKNCIFHRRYFQLVSVQNNMCQFMCRNDLFHCTCKKRIDDNIGCLAAYKAESF